MELDKLKIVTYRVQNMMCTSCDALIEEGLLEVSGVEYVAADFNANKVEVTFDPDQISEKTIKFALDELHYPVQENNSGSEQITQWLIVSGIVAVVVSLYTLLSNLGVFNQFPMAEEGTALPMLFVIGLVTSIHCISMCGGIQISQAIGAGPAQATSTTRKILPAALYNVGRVVSYTVIGGIAGAIGAALTPSLGFKGAIMMAASVFMLVMGISMLGIPALRRFVIRLPKSMRGAVNKERVGKGPFVVGLLNGFMPCGPLQAIQLFALSTGSALLGALSMFLFSLGTVPLMLALGIASAMLSTRFTGIMTKVGAVLVILLSFVMFTNGLGFFGIALPF